MSGTIRACLPVRSPISEPASPSTEIQNTAWETWMRFPPARITSMSPFSPTTARAHSCIGGRWLAEATGVLLALPSGSDLGHVDGRGLSSVKAASCCRGGC